jgi:monoamine oxidase
MATNAYRVWYRPDFEVKYLDALRARHGSVIFANSDWAEGGWRSFIDGAIQSGTEAASKVKNELADLRKAQPML